MELNIHVDGGARGNPGPAGAGVTISEQRGNLVFEAAYFLGRQTNNTAEYQALIRALRQAVSYDARTVTVYSDSELLVRQITGEYRVKSPRLAGLYQQVQTLLLKVPCWSVRHVRREQNRRADELANLAIDQQRDIILFDAADTTGKVPTDTDPHAPSSAPRHDRPAPATPRSNDRRTIQVSLARAADPEHCPAGGASPETFTIETRLPAGLCVHAAHAILPTVLAMRNTEPEEFGAVPTLTVRCTHAGCGAVFQLTPVLGSNGTPPPTEK